MTDRVLSIICILLAIISFVGAGFEYYYGDGDWQFLAFLALWHAIFAAVLK